MEHPSEPAYSLDALPTYESSNPYEVFPDVQDQLAAIAAEGKRLTAEQAASVIEFMAAAVEEHPFEVTGCLGAVLGLFPDSSAALLLDGLLADNPAYAFTAPETDASYHDILQVDDYPIVEMVEHLFEHRDPGMRFSRRELLDFLKEKIEEVPFYRGHLLKMRANRTLGLDSDLGTLPNSDEDLSSVPPEQLLEWSAYYDSHDHPLEALRYMCLAWNKMTAHFMNFSYKIDYLVHLKRLAAALPNASESPERTAFSEGVREYTDLIEGELATIRQRHPDWEQEIAQAHRRLGLAEG